MKLWSPHNYTIFLIARFGVINIPSNFRREFSILSSFESTLSIISTSFKSSKPSYFFQPVKQATFYHSSSLLSIPIIESGREENHKKYQKRQNGSYESLPIFIVPGLTSFFFYSTKNDASHFVEGSSFNISTGVYCISKTDENPKKDKNCTPFGCGEDSFCVAENENEVVLGVADGVGGWREKGVDPSVFSQTLMFHAAEISKFPSESFKSDEDRGKTLIHDAFWRLVDDFKTGKRKPFGSSTACVVMIDRNTGMIKFGNLGDSGFVILSPIDTVGGLGSKYKIKFKSQSQQYSFNFPYQITLAPPNGRASDTSALTDTDKSPYQPKNLSVEPGDIILLMTDGVIDNIFDDELEEIVSTSINIHARKKSSSEVPKLIAQDIAFKARSFSEDSKRESPFTIEARKVGRNHLGGKEDDITVVAAVIYSK